MRPNLSFELPSRLDPPTLPAIWHIADGVCALADCERHLGHAVLEGNDWVAYDAVHPNRSCNGFRFLGRFSGLIDAKRAIEDSVGVTGAWVGSRTCVRIGKGVLNPCENSAPQRIYTKYKETSPRQIRLGRE